MTRHILTGIGECMVELAPAGDGLMRQSYAGDVFNTLWYASAALGPDWSTRFFTAVGTDPVSSEMLGYIGSAGIDCSGVVRIPDRRPGLYMIRLDGAERSFTYWRENSAARLLAADYERLRTAVVPSQVIYLSGITLAILPPGDAVALTGLMRDCRAAGATIAFDPNIRPVLWDDRQRMRDTLMAAAAASSIVLPGFDDEKAAFGDTSPEATADRYAAAGAGLVVLKDGAGTVLVRSGGELAAYPTPAVDDPVDTTGAGDSFNGAFLACHIRTGDIAASVAAGQACAAVVIRHRGALIPRDRLAEAVG
ncbi:MAG: sugar kinase [Rhodospirillales bacterium]